MRISIVMILTCTLLFLSSGVFALSITGSELGGLTWTYSPDLTDDEAGSATYDTFGMGTAISGGFLYVVVQTNFPKEGALGGDSYTSTTTFSPGDLYLNVGGTFQAGGGSVYGLATTTHGNVVQQAYPGEVWTHVTLGSLYSNAVFTTGTYEQYQAAYPSYSPDDGDGNNLVNSYPTLIQYGSLVAGDVSAVRYDTLAPNSQPWAYEIYYKVDLDALGLGYGETVQAFWTMECGNDGVQAFATNRSVPEPSTIALMAAGVAAFAARRRTII